jgi:hypothetical protein
MGLQSESESGVLLIFHELNSVPSNLLSSVSSPDPQHVHDGTSRDGIRVRSGHRVGNSIFPQHSCAKLKMINEASTYGC